MEKIALKKISVGIYWLEIPEIDLYIQCGCPENSVKHLRLANFIKQIANTQFETGPNAVLLSDNSVQNDKFSNLCEFTFLQMFYRQGYIIPKSPFFGQKPLIIGSKNQIDVQIQYTMIGNYGLSSIEELLETGLDQKTAKIIYDIKLKFAMGEIKPPNELFDYHIVDNKKPKCEKYKGLQISRVANNVFEFKYKNEKVEVDLNLGKQESYLAPYKLPFITLPIIPFGVVHSGQGDAWSVDLPCMNSILQYLGNFYLIDAPPNLNYILDCLGISIQEIKGVFISHCHDDHFAGITSLITSDKKIKLYGTKFVLASIAKKFQTLTTISPDVGQKQTFTESHALIYLKRYFKLSYLELDTWTDVSGLEVQANLSPHPVETTMFQFRVPNIKNNWFNPKNTGLYTNYLHLADTTSFRTLDEFYGKPPAWKKILGIGNPKWLEKVRKNYLKPANLKKIDIGGGLIHGDWNDYQNDKSDKIVWAHRSDVPKEALEFGKQHEFGFIDKLNSYIYEETTSKLSNQYLLTIAQNLLIRNYEMFMKNQQDLNQLLDGSIEYLKPNDYISQYRQKEEKLFLILSGKAIAYIQDNVLSESSGSIIGEFRLLGRSHARDVIAQNHMIVMRLNRDKFLKILAKHNITELLKKTINTAKLLSFLPEFQGMSAIALKKLISLSTYIKLKKGENIKNKFTDAQIIITLSGEGMYYTKYTSAPQKPKSICGEELLMTFSKNNLFPKSSISEYIATKSCQLLVIPFTSITEIPVMRWRITSLYFKRFGFMIESQQDTT